MPAGTQGAVAQLTPIALKLLAMIKNTKMPMLSTSESPALRELRTYGLVGTVILHEGKFVTLTLKGVRAYKEQVKE